jgi:hypothetical protein
MAEIINAYRSHRLLAAAKPCSLWRRIAYLLHRADQT